MNDIKKIMNMIQQIEFLNSLKDSVSYGQTPDYMLQDRSVKQGVMSEDSLFSNQGVMGSMNSLNTKEVVDYNFPELGKPMQEKTSVSFSDFFGDPKYLYEESVMLPKRDELD